VASRRHSRSRSTPSSTAMVNGRGTGSCGSHAGAGTMTHSCLSQCIAASRRLAGAGRPIYYEPPIDMIWISEMDPRRLRYFMAVEYNLLPSLLAAFRRRYPGVLLTLHEAMSDRQLDELESGILDVGLMTAPVDRPSIARHTIWREQVIVALPTRHRLARSTHV